MRLAFASMGLAAILAAAPAAAQTPATTPAPAEKAAPSNSEAPKPPAKALAEMKNVAGKAVGQALFTQTLHGVLIRVELTGLPAGWHGLHLHETGVCEPPFTSAGGHFAPRRNAHGYEGESGPHAGDMPNILIGSDGTGTVEIFNDRISLAVDQPGERGLLDRAIGAIEGAAGVPSNTLFGEKGTALILHERADDYRTDPDGDAGDRIACGVVKLQT